MSKRRISIEHWKVTPHISPFRNPLYMAEVLLIATFMITALLVGLHCPRCMVIAKFLDVLGFINATYLTFVAFDNKLMPAAIRPRLEYIEGTEYNHKPELYFKKAFPYIVFKNIPIAFWGAGTYGLLSIMSFLNAPLWMIAVLSGYGVLFSARMMYIMFGKIRVTCPFCIFSAGTMTVVFTLTLTKLI
jgi:hypothetical protein